MTEEETYVVRLLFEVPAGSHEAAVERVIDQLSRYGIIDWVYRSQRISDGGIEHLNGDLERIDLEELKQSLEQKELTYADRPVETVKLSDAQGGDDE